MNFSTIQTGYCNAAGMGATGATGPPGPSGGSPGAPSLSLQANDGAGGFIGAGLLLWDKTIVSSTIFAGVGLDDCVFSGPSTVGSLRLYADIDSTGTPDTIEWSLDDGNTFNATMVPITASNSLIDGIVLTCGATTGHTSGDAWRAATGVLRQNPSFNNSGGVLRLPQFTSGAGLNSISVIPPGSGALYMSTIGIDGAQVVSGPLGILGTGLAGQATCWKTNEIISYCDSVVGAMGACTCH